MNKRSENPSRPAPAPPAAAAHIVVYGNPGKAGVEPILRSLFDWAEAGGHRISIEDGIAPHASRQGADRLAGVVFFDGSFAGPSPQEAARQPTLLLTLGGDGTLLHAVHRFWPLHMPVLAVSLGTLSFHSDLPPENVVAMLEAWLAGKTEQSDRMVLRAVQMRSGKPIAEAVALNDVVLGKQENLRMIHLTLRQGPELVASFAGDGLIVSTPTGSTAYNLSAGGPIVFPTMSALVATAICPHTLAARSVVLEPHPPLVMEYVPRNPGGLATLAIDGQIQWTLQADDKVVVEASDRRLALIAGGRGRYFERLRRKLSLSGDIEPADTPA